MKVTLIIPHVGRKSVNEYVRTWQMEPLPIATLAGLTPRDVEMRFFDERIEDIDFDDPTNLVGINVEAYTAKRAYEIAAEYRKRGVHTILGGYHVMLMPHEALQYADSILAGYAEGVWETVLRDAEHGRLKRRYDSIPLSEIEFTLPRRDILQSNKYLPISCVETGRGCPFACNFCSIAAATHSQFKARPVDLIVQDIKSLKHKTVFFVDDNIVGNFKHAKTLLRALIPLKIKWMGQGSLNVARDEEMLQLMADSGCIGILVGFESLKQESLRLMDKDFMTTIEDTPEFIRRLHAHGLAIYGTFIFGYETDTPEDFAQTVDFAIKHGIFMGAFNHLMPFPGTPLYRQFEREGRLISDAWWLEPDYRFNDVPFTPKHVSREDVRRVCLKARRKFYSIPSIIKRARNVRGNLNSIAKIWGYVFLNSMLRKEIGEKDGLPLGNSNERPTPLQEVTHGDTIPVRIGTGT
ncbi:MAG: B12-binding domain-containing radical SAM protein [Candidatus Pacebacteria bacterium]|nr:B12-binding domain-containing radical SAM protein [Candidatus Paceibacterota bacterium]